MEMKKIACGVLFAAASLSAVMAQDAGAPAPGASAGGPGASAPGPAASGAYMAVPALGSLVGASLVSLFTYYLN